ncbi:winged helix-turn-helix transcriptional regulator [Candidatus Bathyarchaeota archaeon]|nr:MAG: winged helix-turn-helix transcriptional regulator [Candidatus Bathyarchaeota archaeon]TMI31544.1 MAG: winged helix-turn-helix transcriptional regulator [Candidatus Bathyarchaeota archaeon]
MDSKDFQLLAALYENALQSYRSLGHRTSLSAPAARGRLQALESKGIIQGYWVSPDPSIFRRQDLLAFYDRQWTRSDALRALAVQDVAWVAWKVDGGLTVQVWPQSRKESIEDLTRVLKEPPFEQAWVDHPPKEDLSLIDWRIIEALLDHPRIELQGLCDSTHFSPKTVRKHLGTLIREEAVYISPKIGSLADSGEVIYHLAVTGDVSLNELRRTLGDLVLVNEAHEPSMKYLLCRANDLADVTSRIQAANELPGVGSVRVTLNRELLVANGFVHGLVRERIRNLEKTWKSNNGNV